MRIAISGAGVAGPALAYWLRRIGHVPTLIEKAPQLRTGGYVIDFWGVGYQVAQRMGIESTLRQAGYQVQRLDAVDSAGRVRASMRMDTLARATRDRFTSLPRGDVSRIIYDTVKAEVETIFADSIAALDEQADGVHVRFEHGSARDFDLVIGADGLHSNVRRLVFGPESQFERYLGCRVAACVVEGYRPRDELVYVIHNVPGRQLGRFALRGDRTLFLFVFRSDDTSDPGSLDARKALLRHQFADAGWECPQILEALGHADELYFDVVSQIRMDCWSRGRVALLGDAAACISLLGGEGTGLAMTEAYVLAGELQRAGGDWRRAFAQYESRLRPLVEGKQASAENFIGFFATRSRLGIWLRDQAMRMMRIRPLAHFVVNRSLSDDFELPDYGM